ncbi:hypothetical protein [Streptomyces yangpuensis]
MSILIRFTWAFDDSGVPAQRQAGDDGVEVAVDASVEGLEAG